MFHDIPEAMLARMAQLEEMDARDRHDGTGRLQRLRQVPRDVGKFAAILAASTPPGRWIEIGTSAGYSTLWLALAARDRPARHDVRGAGGEGRAGARNVRPADRREGIVESVPRRRPRPASRHGRPRLLLDSEKADYGRSTRPSCRCCVPGGLLVTDNAVGFEDVMQPMLDRALTDPRVDGVIVPFLTGQLISRKR